MTVVVDLTPVRTLGDLKDRIGVQLARTQEFGSAGSLADECGLAIQDAISEAAGNRFWFNELRGLTIPLIAGQEYYGSEDLGYATKIDAIWFNRNGNQRQDIYVTNNDEMNRMNVGDARGQPYRYSIYGDRLRIYPLPQTAYTLYIYGVSRLEPLNSDEQSNAWTNEGERYIRALAKRNLLLDTIDDPEKARAQDIAAERYKNDLLGQTFDRIGTGEMRAWCG